VLDPYGLGTMLEVGLSALRRSGCAPLATVGGELRTVGSDAVAHLPDDHPGEGPLGGILTALRWSSQELVVVLACDMPFLIPEVIDALLGRIRSEPELDVVVGVVGDREQPLTAVWRRTRSLEVLQRSFERGERAPRRILPELATGRIEILTPEAVVDIDSAADIHRYAHLAERGSDRRRGGES
jgi:molybdopterin-guanine dinucleotide biosynthesis protein A